ncbi:MAG: TIGR00725 family protein [Halodesulfurarchaeum sp.]
MRISVIGGSTVDRQTYETARRLGCVLGERGHDVVSGGLTGVMTAVSEGLAGTDGQSIGILPGRDLRAANQYVDVPIATGIGNARNVLVVRNGRAAIAIDGSTGTLSEIAHALDLGRPVAGLDTHDVDGVEAVESVSAAVDYVEAAVEDRL